LKYTALVVQNLAKRFVKRLAAFVKIYGPQNKPEKSSKSAEKKRLERE